MPAFSTTKDSRIPFNNDNQQRLKRMKRQSGFRDADRNEDEDDDDDDDDDDSWSVFDPYVSRFSDLFCPPPLYVQALVEGHIILRNQAHSL